VALQVNWLTLQVLLERMLEDVPLLTLCTWASNKFAVAIVPKLTRFESPPLGAYLPLVVNHVQNQCDRPLACSWQSILC